MGTYVCLYVKAISELVQQTHIQTYMHKIQ